VLIISRYLVNDSSKHIFRKEFSKMVFTISFTRSTAGTGSYPDSTQISHLVSGELGYVSSLE